MSWSGFLASLETEGGKMIVLIFISSLMGILYGYLKAGGSKT